MDGHSVSSRSYLPRAADGGEGEGGEGEEEPEEEQQHSVRVLWIKYFVQEGMLQDAFDLGCEPKRAPPQGTARDPCITMRAARAATLLTAASRAAIRTHMRLSHPSAAPPKHEPHFDASPLDCTPDCILIAF